MRLVIIGCGSMGSHLAMEMLRRGNSVSVIDEDPAAEARLSGARAKFLLGVGIDLSVLREAGIEKADGLAAVTGSDDVNLAASMIARKSFRVPSVVARVFDPGKMVAYRTAGISVVCPLAWGFRAITDILVRPAREEVMSLGHGEVRIMSVTAGSRSGGTPIRQITTPEISAISLVRNGVALAPNVVTTVEPGDVLYMSVPLSQMASFDRLAESLEG